LLGHPRYAASRAWANRARQTRAYDRFVFERQRDYPAAYVHKATCRDDEILLALRWLIDQQNAVGGEILVLASGLDVLDRSPLIRKNRASLRCESERTFKKNPYAWSGGPALALWPSAGTLALLDDHDDVRALAAAPWLLEETEAWRRARRPVDLLGQVVQEPETTIAEPVVRVALEHLTVSVNLGTGLTHPSDKAHAVRMFEILRAGGHRWDPPEVRAWALTHGWDNRGADDLERYATGILQGRSFRTQRYLLRDDVLELWREEAATGSG
jgi:hypothetical protein